MDILKFLQEAVGIQEGDASRAFKQLEDTVLGLGDIAQHSVNTSFGIPSEEPQILRDLEAGMGVVEQETSDFVNETLSRAGRELGSLFDGPKRAMAAQPKAQPEVEQLMEQLGVTDPLSANMGPHNTGGAFSKSAAGTSARASRNYQDLIEGATQQLTRSRANRAAEKASKSEKTMGDVAELLAVGTSNVKKEKPIDFSGFGLSDDMAAQMGSLPVELQNVFAKSLVENLAAQQGGGKKSTFKDIESLVATLMYERAMKDQGFLDELLNRGVKK